MTSPRSIRDIAKPAPIVLHLPFPPSVNHAYANGGKKRGRHKTAAYRLWESLAGLRVKDSHRLALPSYSLAICLRRPDRRARDLGNYEKCVSDLLVAHGIVRDDSCCERLTLEWSEQEPECVVIIEAERAPMERPLLP